MQKERKTRLTTSDIKSIQKIAAWGKAHQKYRKPAIALLTLMLLWFYLLSALRLFWSKRRIKYAACVAVMSIMIIFLYSYDMDGNISDKIIKETAVDFGINEQAIIEREEDFSDIIELQRQNSDCVGWLFIMNTDISYPLMQHKEDEDYYLDRDFYGNEDSNGCLILANDSDLERSGGNLIIHGHNMVSGEMFGNLNEFKNESYLKGHGLIWLKTEKEIRAYLLISAFYSKVFYEDEDVFKYYQYFGGTKEEFDDFYSNIKELSIYDTGVEAEYGTEFITLSTCAYHVENGRFVVVGKRIY